MFVESIPPNSSIVLMLDSHPKATGVVRQVCGTCLVYIYTGLMQGESQEHPFVYISDPAFRLLRLVSPFAPYVVLPDAGWETLDETKGGQLSLLGTPH